MDSMGCQSGTPSGQSPEDLNLPKQRRWQSICGLDLGIVECFNYLSPIELTCQRPATIEGANALFILFGELVFEAAVEIVERGLLFSEYDEALIGTPVLGVPPLSLDEKVLADDLH